MPNDKLNFLDAFKTIEHPYFSLQSYKPLLIQAFAQNAKSIMRGGETDWINALSTTFYEALFERSNASLRATLDKIQSRIEAPHTLETLLSDFFCVVLNHYIKASYGHQLGWKRIARLSDAVDDLIDWSRTLDFSTLSAANLLSPEEMALETLEQIRLKSTKIDLLNTYMGVPISYKAHVLHTTEKCAYIKAHPIQEAAAKQQQGVYILASDLLETDIYARVKPVRYKGNILLELHDLQPLQSGIYRRQNIRVEPEGAISAVIVHEEQRFKLQLFDLSLGGAALLSPKNLPLDLYASVRIELPERLAGKPLEINARLVHVSVFEHNQKYHFQLHLKGSEEQLLGRYIKRREQEIIHTLKMWS
ncbi:MAG: PilZ domain-containing protein [Campylobacterales bacterium]|nr:PilZ domain-containing protein [Campylobacterales bacterium]